jgi:hypothetical protein
MIRIDDQSMEDIAVTLMPPHGDHNWALGEHVALAKVWQRELESIVGRQVSFGAIEPDTPVDTEVRAAGVLLWVRTAAHPTSSTGLQTR